MHERKLFIQMKKQFYKYSLRKFAKNILVKNAKKRRKHVNNFY